MEELCWASSTGVAIMNKVTAFMSFIFLVVSSAWAQTPPATPGAPPAGDAGGGIMDYLVGDPADHHRHCSDLVLLSAWQECVGICPFRNGSWASSIDQKPF
jgi:hypothetical protein